MSAAGKPSCLGAVVSNGWVLTLSATYDRNNAGAATPCVGTSAKATTVTVGSEVYPVVEMVKGRTFTAPTDTKEQLAPVLLRVGSPLSRVAANSLASSLIPEVGDTLRATVCTARHTNGSDVLGSTQMQIGSENKATEDSNWYVIRNNGIYGRGQRGGVLSHDDDAGALCWNDSGQLAGIVGVFSASNSNSSATADKKTSYALATSGDISAWVDSTTSVACPYTDEFLEAEFLHQSPEAPYNKGMTLAQDIAWLIDIGYLQDELDTDGDSLPDSYEMDYTKTHPCKVDTSGDGVWDADEF